MAKKIVWSDYLKEEAIYRFWYTLENNNFKNAIKNAQKQGKMNYSSMHNALYSGLYYPEKDYVYPYRTVKDIREDKSLSKNATLANFMERNEILMNIHSMNQSARAIRKLAPFGYNAKLFAKEFEQIGKIENSLRSKIKIKNERLFNTASEKGQEKNKPNRYNLSRQFAKKQKKAVNIFSQHPSTEREKQYEKALKQYLDAKTKFAYQLIKNGISQSDKTQLVFQFLDSGVYRSSIPHFGFNFDSLLEETLKTNNSAKHITRAELMLHTDKLNLGIKAIMSVKGKPIAQIEEAMLEAGMKARFKFIKKHKTYPETKIGFLNSFCEMLSKNLEVNPLLKDKVMEKGTQEMADSLIDVIVKLKNQHKHAQSAAEKKEVDLQIKKIHTALEKSNEHNI